MNAEEYKQIEIAFIAKYAHHWIATEFQEDLKEVSIAYHQAKSKEEAEDVVIKIIEAVSSEYRGAVELDERYGLGEIIETIRSTAFGKEDEG